MNVTELRPGKFTKGTVAPVKRYFVYQSNYGDAWLQYAVMYSLKDINQTIKPDLNLLE